MSAANRGSRFLATAASVALFALMQAPAAVAQQEALTIDRITSLPSITGTTPSEPVWSPDSTRIAFLWNDHAMPFRDIWIANASGGAPVRVTTLEEQEPPAPPPGKNLSLKALTERAAARTRSGIADVIWTPDGSALIFAYRGDLHRIAPDGSGLERLTTSGGGKSRLTYSPDGRQLSFLQGGDLCLWHVADRSLIRATNVGVPPIGTTPAAASTANGRRGPVAELVAGLDAPRAGLRRSPSGAQGPVPVLPRRRTDDELGAARRIPATSPRPVLVYTVARRRWPSSSNLPERPRNILGLRMVARRRQPARRAGLGRWRGLAGCMSFHGRRSLDPRAAARPARAPHVLRSSPRHGEATARRCSSSTTPASSTASRRSRRPAARRQTLTSGAFDVAGDRGGATP